MNDKDKKFSWTGDHQEAFCLLKTHLTSVPVLSYADFSRPFDLKTNASLQGLGAMLSQRDKNSKSMVITYASRSLWPNEQTMWNYSSAKLALLASSGQWLRNLVISFWNLSLLHILTSTHLHTSKRASWSSSNQMVSEIVLFNFDIKYRMGKSDEAADALSHHPKSNTDISGDEGKWRRL